MLTPYALRTPVIARIDGADRLGEIRGRCHPIDGGDLYDVMTVPDRVIHCNVRPEQIEPAAPALR